ncbi:hypothetical protein IIZ77_01980, partial [Candidatus Saccharibacteria bacterium]|nr:hypothetical protein [Candidatus Saccharibacteria bacterium]
MNPMSPMNPADKIDQIAGTKPKKHLPKKAKLALIISGAVLAAAAIVVVLILFVFKKDEPVIVKTDQDILTAHAWEKDGAPTVIWTFHTDGSGEITTNKYDAKDFNTFCSIVTWYKRQLDKEARDIEYSEKAKAEKASGIGTEFVADKGERVTVSGTIKSKRNNGSYIVQDDKGHLIQIFSDIDVENGTKITVTG